jgi:hypothetical protein
MRKLQEGGHALISRYDWHLAVAPITESIHASDGPWTCIGIDLSYLQLKPHPKRQFTALLDFIQPGYEEYHDNHLRILKELGIESVALNGNYSLDEIRELYRNAAIFFVETPEAFGVPIAECLAFGTRVYLPNAEWAMSWRRRSLTAGGAPRDLPSVFVTYDSWDDLKRKVAKERDAYDLTLTPLSVFEGFIASYPEYYFGDRAALNHMVERIRRGELEQSSR